MYYELKSIISSTFVQLTLHIFNETKRMATKFEGLQQNIRIIRSLSKFCWLFLNLEKIYQECRPFLQQQHIIELKRLLINQYSKLKSSFFLQTEGRRNGTH